MQLRVLILIEDSVLRSRLVRILDDVDAFVRVSEEGRTGQSGATHMLSDVLIVSRSLVPDPLSEGIAALMYAPGSPAVIVLSNSHDAEEVAALRAAGAEAALYVGVPDDVLGGAIRGIVERRRELLVSTLVARRVRPDPELSDFVSTSPVMQRFIQTVHRVVDSDAPLLVTGETGVGKERIARAVHRESRRGDGPFISMNCGAIPENLLESQLFGYEKGAFTGATRTQRGCFELAHGGTLFLDEIAEVPFHLQVKFLHVLQDFEVSPVGSEKKIPVDVRVIAATNRDIRKDVEEKRFRQDLYYRLSVVSVDVPPLRERSGDIPALVPSILEELCTRIGRTVHRITQEALAAMCAYEWPGNVRELINVLERAVLLCDGDELSLSDLPEEIAKGEGGKAAVLPDGTDLILENWLERPLKEIRDVAIERVETAYLTKLLARTGGRVGETARRAGIEPRSLYNKMKRYGLRKDAFRKRPGP